MVAKNETDRTVVIIHYPWKAAIREGKLEDVANGDKCAVDNSLDYDCTPLSPAETVQRARSRVSNIALTSLRYGWTSFRDK